MEPGQARRAGTGLLHRTLPALLLLTLAFRIGPTPSGASTPTDDSPVIDRKILQASLSGSPLTEEEQALHVANRLGYGPTPGEVERIRKIGIPAYLEEQLHPERIDDSDLERRLRGLGTLFLTPRELAAMMPAPGAAPRRGDPAGRESQPPETMSAGRPADPSADPSSERRQEMAASRRIGLELQQAKLLRAVYSRRQLEEVMTDFWFNHFNVFFAKGADRIFVNAYEQESIRPRVLADFRDLLGATAKSPAMLFYLDNWMSVSPEAKIPTGRPARADAAAQAVRMRSRGLNENYARELLELHTLGVDGGYTQKDVTEVARCFTGWTLRNPRLGGGFQFLRILHDDGGKTVLGTPIPAGGGIRDGERVLDLLAGHPATARLISSKLCRRFVSDDPPAALVDRCSQAFLNSRGNIRRVLAVIFTSPEFYARETCLAKVKKPFELVASSLRASGAETRVPPRLLAEMRNMGEVPYGCQPPTGYPDRAEDWINSGSLLERMNFAVLLASGRLPGTTTTFPDPETGDAVEFIRIMARRLLNREPEAGVVQSIRQQLASAGESAQPSRNAGSAYVAALILGSPEFQKR